MSFFAVSLPCRFACVGAPSLANCMINRCPIRYNLSHTKWWTIFPIASVHQSPLDLTSRHLDKNLSHRCPFRVRQGTSQRFMCPARCEVHASSAVQVYQLLHKKRNTYHTKASVYWDPEVDVVFMGVRGVQVYHLSRFCVTAVTVLRTTYYTKSVSLLGPKDRSSGDAGSWGASVTAITLLRYSYHRFP